ncbi:MAG: ribonuclease P protein component [Phycisphaerae bacterium]
MTIRRRFRAEQRLTRQGEFDRVFARRCSVGDRRLVIYAVENGSDITRLGVKVGKRMGGAVTRSRIRRRLREAFRTQQHGLPRGLDVVCIPRVGGSGDAGVGELADSMFKLLHRAQDKLSKGVGPDR